MHTLQSRIPGLNSKDSESMIFCINIGTNMKHFELFPIIDNLRWLVPLVLNAYILSETIFNEISSTFSLSLK